MNRAWAWGVVVLFVGLTFIHRRVHACTPVKQLTPNVMVSPTAGALLGTDAAMLLREDDAALHLTLASEARIPLEPILTFAPLRPQHLPLVFYRPTRPLLADADYELGDEGGGVTIPFRTTAAPPHVDASLSISVVQRTVPEDVLGSASCYTGPLADRPFTRVADVTVRSTPDTHYVVSINTLDSVSGQLIEDTALHRAGEATGFAHFELPLPAGIADCLRVRVVDVTGVVIADEGSLCAGPDADTRTVPAAVFAPTTAELPEPELDAPPPPTNPLRTSEGCALARPAASGGGAMAIVLALLGVWRRVSRRP